jgi:hypothetical protein
MMARVPSILTKGFLRFSQSLPLPPTQHGTKYVLKGIQCRYITYDVTFKSRQHL